VEEYAILKGGPALAYHRCSSAARAVSASYDLFDEYVDDATANSFAPNLPKLVPWSAPF
jgi:hypothetical protein